MPTKDYERHNPKLLDRIENSEDISEKNKQILLDFHRDLKVQDYSKARIYKLLQHLKTIGEKIDFEFDEANKEEIKDVVAWINNRGLADSTKRDYKVILKRFYKWVNDGGYPECVIWINTTNKKKNNSLPEDMLTEDDIERLLESAKHNRDKALISLLWETGARIGELIDLKVGSLEDHKHGLKVVIDGKTGARRLSLISSVPHIRSWINSHPKGDNPDASLWVNIGNTNYGEPMQYRTILKMLRETKKRADVEKPVNPHQFRHSRATYLANKFTESQLCEWFGWVQGSDQAQRYVHLSGRDLDSAYAKVHGIEDEEKPEESKLSPIDCPRCEEQNDPNSKFCHRCGQALTRKLAEQVEEKEEGVIGRFAELNDEEVLQTLETVSKMYKLAKNDPDIAEKLDNLGG